MGSADVCVRYCVIVLRAYIRAGAFSNNNGGFITRVFYTRAYSKPDGDARRALGRRILYVRSQSRAAAV